MSKIFGQILLQIILILLNAFFAATEIAVISLNGNKLKVKAEDGDKKAKKMLRMVEEPTGFLSTIQIGITLAGFLGSAFAADNFSDLLVNWLIHTCRITFLPESTLNAISVVLITLVLSYFTLVLGELVPKRIAMKRAESLANAVCGVITFLSRVLKPIIWFLTKSTNAVLRLFGIDPHSNDETVSEEDIVTMLEAGGENGTIRPEEIEYIKNVFEFNDLSVADIMVPRSAMTYILSDSSRDRILQTIRESGFSRIPVCEGSVDKVVGILQVKTYLLGNASDPAALEQAMIPAKFIPESLRVDHAFREMQDGRFQMAVVVDEYGGTSGIITIEDMLEELVGDIWDEHDKVEEDFRRLDEQTYLVKGNVRLDDLADYFEIEPESEANTVSGWIVEQLGRMPEVGDKLEYDGLVIEAKKINNRVIGDVLIIKPEKPE